MPRWILALLGGGLGDQLRTRNAIDFRTLGIRDFPILFVEAVPDAAEKCEDETMANETNLTPEQMAARIAELEGRLAKGSSLSFKVSEKGGVSVYGLGRFPVTLYLEQWDALLSHAAELREFIEANKSRLKIKDQTKR